MDAKPLIDWKDELALGIDAFDREHRDLVEAINRLHALGRKKAEPAVFRTALDHLIHVTEDHFTHEETVLRHHGCTNLGMHQREHDELLEDIAALRLVGDDPAEVAGMLGMLRDWLVDHIMNFDCGYRACLEDKEIR
ncbi:MAG: bacteriohemerythrin [Gammaproteobacteria bacterium]|nr:bacteriohemerythrin [Gammaproteobacteria bacterium]